jgi:hypothetical protein
MELSPLIGDGLPDGKWTESCHLSTFHVRGSQEVNGLAAVVRQSQ